MSRFAALAQHSWDDEFVTLKSALSESVVAAETAFRHERDATFLSTGLRDLDFFLGGLYPSDLVIVAGRPGAGKTSLAASIAFHVARSGPIGEPVAFFSLENSSEQLATRIISGQTEIPSSKISRGEITETDFERLVACSQMMQKSPLFIDQTTGISISEIAARARRLKRQHGLALIVIDYLQLMRPPSQTDSYEQLDISTISQGLKAVAEDLNVPVLALSRVSHAAERNDNQLVLSDLEEFGSIAQDADVVMFLDFHPQREESTGDAQSTIEVIIAKQPRGPTGVVALNFDASIMRFSSPSGGDVQKPLAVDDLDSSTGLIENTTFLERAAALRDEEIQEEPVGDAVPAFATAELLGGAVTLGKSIRSPADLARAVQAGFPTTVLDCLRDAGISAQEIETLVAPARTLARRRKDGRLTIDESAAVERIARILVIAARVLGGRDAALAWLRGPQVTQLSGSTPLAYVRSDIGARVVEEILLQAEYGLTA
ncbi:DnaB-like helicase C-terminal domain-containing protein [Allomesorhizobium camelthorni]|uniref:AAA family ATPase n=1 Tax=Allomesorhizobium camelthorni TaxID=475069 RepID=A0A6G4WMI7_9HYPH|nr:DnaB-like helicase C-terminal domain-containing protein [Mesorhizobium camelthorni]NGO56032.1 AAA family ATPase [Mesorhizobium camelthorni]